MLLLVAGDVELNPGPGSATQETEDSNVVDSLTQALAVLVGQAPSSEVKLVLAAWAPDKTSIAEDLNKFKVPALKQALAWLWNRDISDKVVNRKNKAEVIQCVIIAIEVLLPDTCSVCDLEYSIGREETPALRCKGCYQGFHQPCLEKMLGGLTILPKLPGSLYWLCSLCSPNYELMTTTGGSKPAASRKRLAPAHGLDGEPRAVPAAGVEDIPAKKVPGPTIRSGLPYLWPGPTGSVSDENDSADSAQSEVPEPPPIPPPPPTVRSGLPYLWAPVKESVQVCDQYLKGECSHGISGKVNGVCDKTHPKRCAKYMKWGNKHENGCKLTSCDKVHPVLCDKSHDLKCLDLQCSFKLHTLKCERQQQGGRGGQQTMPEGGPGHHGVNASDDTRQCNFQGWAGPHRGAGAGYPAGAGGGGRTNQTWHNRGQPGNGHPTINASAGRPVGNQTSGGYQPPHQGVSGTGAGQQVGGGGVQPLQVPVNQSHRGPTYNGAGQHVGNQTSGGVGHQPRHGVPGADQHVGGGYGQPPPHVTVGQPQGVPGYTTSNSSNSGFQGLTVQQLLEAHFKVIKQELDRQKQELSIFQHQIQQQLRASQGEGSLDMGARHSY